MNASYFAQQALVRETDKFPLIVEMLIDAKHCKRVAPSTITCSHLTAETLQLLQTVMKPCNTTQTMWRKI